MASAIMFDKMLLCTLHIPLVDRSKTFHVFKIHNLPLPVLILNKQLKHRLDLQCLVISTDKLYVTFLTADEIFSCRMSSGSFCKINNAVYPTNTIRSCEYALFMGKHMLVNKACKVDLANFTNDQAIALDSQFWVITTVKLTTMYITCLTKTFYIELQHLLDIIFPEESCEVLTPSILLPSHTTLSKDISQTKLGQTKLRLNYTDIKDFTAIKYAPLKRIMED